MRRCSVLYRPICIKVSVSVPLSYDNRVSSRFVSVLKALRRRKSIRLNSCRDDGVIRIPTGRNRRARRTLYLWTSSGDGILLRRLIRTLRIFRSLLAVRILFSPGT